MKIKSNNIVLIIGNGFDLSHNFKTGYSDFAQWLTIKIEKEIRSYLLTRTPSTFLNEKFIEYFNQGGFRYTVFQSDEIDGFVNRYIKSTSQNTLNKSLNENSDKIKTIISNEFLGSLFADKYENWFDIENAFFQELILLKNSFVPGNDNSIILEKTKKLNSELIQIKNYLKEYLNTIEIKSNDEVNGFFNTISVFDDLKYSLNIVNFNYTNTIEKYFSKNTNDEIKNVNINYIHGNLLENNIVFGYGNDKHKEYQEIKDLEINEFLENFKTFAYLKNNNYSKVYDDILDNNSIEDYVVFVLGHSLGATDKTLLEEIFNNNKCKKIHLFKRADLFHNKEKLEKTFDDLVFSASRILNNEKDLRKKVLNYKDSEYFPL
jgi:hypothetical protein